MKRSNNKTLLIVLVVLVAGFVASKLFRSPARERNLDDKLVTIDTAKVTDIQVKPAKNKSEQISLVRRGKTWQVKAGHQMAGTDASGISNMLRSLHQIHPERIVTRNKDKWKDYRVDTTGTQVKVMNGAKVLADFWTGTASGSRMVRLDGHDDVYEVSEPIGNYFDKDFNDWRDKTFVHLKPDSVTKINFTYPGDSSFVLQKVGGKWMINGMHADSLAVTRYLNKFRSRSISEFASDVSSPGPSLYTLSLNDNASILATLHAWQRAGDQWILSSSEQEDVYFSSQGNSVISDYFVGKKNFVMKNETK